MREVSQADYESFLASHKSVNVGNVTIHLHGKWTIDTYGPDDDYRTETETIWSFPVRGEWATHVGDYRGNWSPFVPRNLIEKYTRPGEWVLDQMMGSGTTLIECKLLGRNSIGVDVNIDSVMIAKDRLNFDYASTNMPDAEIRTFVGDARKLARLQDDSIDLIATHPPYTYIIRYSNGNIAGDLSNTRSIEEYVRAIEDVATESYRITKPGAHCAILIGDTREHGHFVPISYRVMQSFLSAGFILREDVIKLQWNTRAGRERWSDEKYDFYKIAHEHLYVFRKPRTADELRSFLHSAKWW